MKGYSATVVEASRELTAREKVKYKDTSDCVKLDEALSGEQGNYLVITPIMFVIVEVNNEKSEQKTYSQYIIEDEDGTKYITGSDSFFDTFSDIWSDMTDEDGNSIDGEPWQLKIFKKDSKNYKGKQFITCSLA